MTGEVFVCLASTSQEMCSEPPEEPGPARCGLCPLLSVTRTPGGSSLPTGEGSNPKGNGTAVGGSERPAGSDAPHGKTRTASDSDATRTSDPYAALRSIVGRSSTLCVCGCGRFLVSSDPVPYAFPCRPSEHPERRDGETYGEYLARVPRPPAGSVASVAVLVPRPPPMLGHRTERESNLRAEAARFVHEATIKAVSRVARETGTVPVRAYAEALDSEAAGLARAGKTDEAERLMSLVGGLLDLADELERGEVRRA